MSIPTGRFERHIAHRSPDNRPVIIVGVMRTERDVEEAMRGRDDWREATKDALTAIKEGQIAILIWTAPGWDFHPAQLNTEQHHLTLHPTAASGRLNYSYDFFAVDHHPSALQITVKTLRETAILNKRLDIKHSL